LLRYLTHDYPRAIAEWTQAVLRRPAWAEDLNPWIAQARQADELSKTTGKAKPDMDARLTKLLHQLPAADPLPP
jgi:hypothetical protein